MARLDEVRLRLAELLLQPLDFLQREEGVGTERELSDLDEREVEVNSRT